MLALLDAENRSHPAQVSEKEGESERARGRKSEREGEGERERERRKERGEEKDIVYVCMVSFYLSRILWVRDKISG